MSALIPVSAYLPFFCSLSVLNDERLRWDLLNNREKFLSSLGSFLEIRNSTIRRVTVEKCQPPGNIAAWLKDKSWFTSTRLCHHILVSAEVEVDVDKLKIINNTDHLDESFVSYCATLVVSEALEDALFLSELSYPGFLTVLEGLSIAPGGGFSSINKKQSFTALSFPDENDSLWPDLSTIDLLATNQWATRVGFGRESFATCRVGRAFAALSHVVGLTHQREGEVLFRAMQGLEAFYCDGIGDLRRQLSEKVKIWIGPWNDKRNLIGQLYDVRSAFVHGSSNIEYLGHHRDAWSENQKAKNENNYATTFAVRLLVRTLQRCVESNTTDIRWTFGVESTG